MITNDRFKYCGVCGKILKENYLGVKTIGFDRITGKPIQVHEYGLVCPDSNNLSHHESKLDNGVYTYREPV